MHQFRNILVPIEGDPSRQPVLARAARLAARIGAAIKLIAVVEDFPWYSQVLLPAPDELQATLIRDRSESLKKLADQLRRSGIEAATEVLRGRRTLEIVREVLRGGHDLLMKESEPNPSLFFGSTDMQLLRTCPCPIWLFKTDHAGRAFEKVLVAVDPAPPADETDVLHLKQEEIAPKDESLDTRILDLAGSLADDEGAELHVIHAWTAPGEGLLHGDLMLSQDQVDRYVEDSRSVAMKAVDHLLAKFPDKSGRRSVHLIKGEPADVVAEFATNADVDLIVMGTVARTGIPGLFIGNTAEAILQRVDCSVLAVKPAGFDCPVDLDE